MLADLGAHVVGTPLKFSGTQNVIHAAPPALGQHADTLLAHDLSLSPPERAALRAEGVI